MFRSDIQSSIEAISELHRSSRSNRFRSSVEDSEISIEDSDIRSSIEAVSKLHRSSRSNRFRSSIEAPDLNSDPSITRISSNMHISTQILPFPSRSTRYTFDIPFSISKLKQLELLDLARNQLIGEIPRLIYWNETSASLKFTVLNPKGRIWTMVAGGGASVIYADTVGDLGYASELGNYAEYSGAPNEEEVLQYARVVIDCATANPDGRKRVLLIGGGIANFTDVAVAFNGIIRALREKEVTKKAQEEASEHPWEERLKSAHEQGTLVHLSNLDPEYTSGEAELITVRELKQQSCIVIPVFFLEGHLILVTP
ncbi:hypothetical protein HYC85_014990 [Camellia sinensis]|uniref:ATP-citrate synthase citrate-binding domain-containing protein n=1 Tax=Camellia sinensis TaxID=4442 RepID=A0A7J7H7V9_CAMSI|nr:hypothetical protein HYC85_014990 [Camellia sinensis]